MCGGGGGGGRGEWGVRLTGPKELLSDASFRGTFHIGTWSLMFYGYV